MTQRKTEGYSIEEHAGVIILIHGVGNAELGEIERKVRENLRGVASHPPVREFNWNALAWSEFTEYRPGELAADLFACANQAVHTRPHAKKVLHRSLSWSRSQLSVLLQVAWALLLLLLLAIPAVAVISWAILWYPVIWPLELLVSMLRLTAWSLVAVTVALLVLALISCVAELSLQPLLVQFRHLLIVYLCPFLQVCLLGTRRILYKSDDSVGPLITGTLIASAGSFWLIGMIALLFGQWCDVFGGLLLLTVWLVLIFVMPIVVYRVLVRFGAFVWIEVWKRIADVVRYAGNPAYRHRIQKALDSLVREAIGGNAGKAPIVIVTHSLGSVIAVDSLLHSRLWHGHSVRLITMGSPLRRFFFSFFPGLYFPPSVREAGATIRARLASFGWLNLYRPLDPIGSRIGLPQPIDCSTGQWWGPWKAHNDYWSDPKVHELVRDRWNALDTAASNHWAGKVRTDDCPTTRAMHPIIRRLAAKDPTASRWFWVLVTMAAILSPVGMIGSMLDRNERRNQLQRLPVEGVVRSVDVNYYVRYVPNPQATLDSYYVDHLVFLAPNGVRWEALRRRDLFGRGSHPEIGAGQLIDAIRQAEGAIDYPSLSTTWRLSGVRVRLLPEEAELNNEPTVFELVDYPVVRGMWKSLSNVVFGALFIVLHVVSAALASGCAMGAAVWLFRILLGIPPAALNEGWRWDGSVLQIDPSSGV